MTLTGNIVDGRGTVEWVDLNGDLITVPVSASPLRRALEAASLLTVCSSA